MQEKLARESGAARARNQALLDILQQAADAGGGPAAPEVAAADVQLMALQRAYLTHVRRGFGAWLRDAAPTLQRRHDRWARSSPAAALRCLAPPTHS